MTETEPQPHGAVVVGVDGSANDGQPLQVAIAQARRHHRPLHILHATSIGIVPWTPERLGRQQAITTACLERARSLAPDLEVGSQTVVDDQSAALVRASRTASVVVMGASRLGQIGSVVLGATTGKVASHSRCPVMVVGEAIAPTDARPVVVGVDNEEHSRAAVAWAFAEAAAREASLVALHAWWWEAPGPLSSGVPADGDDDWDDDLESAAQSQRVMMSEMLAGWREKYPDVEVRTEFVRGRARAVLEEASRDAQLLVVGTRGRGGFSGLLLGSVSAHALHHSRCPVAVVPS